MAQVWKIAPGKGAEDWNTFRESGCIGFGWSDLRDYRAYASTDEVLAALEHYYADDPYGSKSGAARMIWQFTRVVRVGDIVVANHGYNAVCGIGLVRSDYIPWGASTNPIPRDATHRRHARLVEWLVTDAVDIPGRRFFIQATLGRLNGAQYDRVREAYLDRHPRLRPVFDQLAREAANDARLPEEMGESPTLFEGGRCQVTVDAHERNPEARRACIEEHGTRCAICKFDFGAFYGPEAEGHIHVHHLNPLSEASGRRSVDPVKDLRPVCPNCHAVIHLGGGCRTIDDVRGMITHAKRATAGR